MAMSLRTPLGRVRGLGSAKSGYHHWWMQRLTAVALVPLSLWFVVSLLSVSSEADLATLQAWASNPLTTALLVGLIVATFYHAALGLQVVYEDYISSAWLRHSVDLATKFICFVLALAGAVSAIMIALGG